jgi:uncharacterized membrane protein
MADWVYQFLASLGYTHPIHPALVHVPIGSIVAAFVFGVIGLLFRKQNVGRAAYYALVLAFVSLLPGIFFATTDWLRYFGGVWLFWIKMKVILSSVLFILLLVAIVTGLRDTGPTRLNVLLSFLCLLTVTGLGYFGANLVYSGTPQAPTKELEAGRQIFTVDCRFCHPQGGNIIRPDLPLFGAPEFSDLKTFTEYIRNPTLPGGKKGAMPRFTSSKISDQQVKALYNYITQILGKEVVRPTARSTLTPAQPGPAPNQ